ncbi:MAG TPA: hypothetical protein DCX14_14505 [Flavobacteriales bacterium]|nr:hypothetical protein [Flavobacteriales bacterium]
MEPPRYPHTLIVAPIVMNMIMSKYALLILVLHAWTAVLRLVLHMIMKPLASGDYLIALIFRLLDALVEQS